MSKPPSFSVSQQKGPAELYSQSRPPLTTATTPESDLFSNNMFILFAGDLSFFCVEQDLYHLFSRCGTVVSVEIKRGKATGDSLLHGFVEMDSPTAVESAIEKLNGNKFMGRRIRFV
jgi:RNA recognition motif-containing protein